MHEVCRGWHPDVANFMIQNGANVNKVRSCMKYVEDGTQMWLTL